MSKPLILLGDVEKSLKSVQSRIDTLAPMFLQLELGEMLEMPQSKPMTSVGKRCHELRFKDGKNDWRIIYRIDSDATILASMFKKKTNKTPKQIIELSQQRLKQYDIDKQEN